MLATIDAQMSSRVLLQNGNGELELIDIGITNGQTAGNADNSNTVGAGLAVLRGDLTLNRVSVTNNSHGSGTSARGGGIGIDFDNANVHHDVTIIDSTISGNTSADHGGGLFFDVDSSAGTSTLTVLRSTFSDNTAGDNGGGMYFAGASTSTFNITVTNSTFTGNDAGTDGGGIYSFAADNIDIYNSTIVDNTAVDEGGGFFEVGSGTNTVTSTIIAGNSAANDGDDIHGDVVSGNHNLFQVTQGSNITGTTTNNITGMAHDLAALADNGGPTMTRLPNSTSPAIDAGSNTQSLTEDQRGATLRAFDDPTSGANSGIDIGAVERGATVANTGGGVTLNSNDIVTVGFSVDAPDDFAVMPLVDLVAGDVIHFTDRGWDTGTNDFLNETDFYTISYTVPAGGVTAGTVLDSSDLLGGGNIGTNHNSGGDQLLIYQTADNNPASTPTFIHAFNLNGPNGADDGAIVDGWFGHATDAPNNDRESNLPAGLTAVLADGDSGSALGLAFLAGELDNARYTGPEAATDKAGWVARITDSTNWTLEGNNFSVESNVFPIGTGNGFFNVSSGGDTELTITGGVLTITDISGADNNDSLSIDHSAGTYTISDSGNLTLVVTGIAGAIGDGTSFVSIPDTGITGIRFDTLGGHDTVTMTNVEAEQDVTIRTHSGGAQWSSLRQSACHFPDYLSERHSDQQSNPAD